MEYIKTTLKEEFVIKRIVSVHYFEFAKNYVYEGERHDFWEFVYVDKGEVEIMAETQGYKLKQGEMYFHKPNEFHSLWANGRIAPNLVVISFECRSKAMEFFENRMVYISDYEKNLIAQVIREAKEAFCSPLDESFLAKLERRSCAAFGSEQLIKVYLELLLISIIRKGHNIKSESRISSSVKERFDEDMLNRIIAYLKENVANNLKFEDIRKFSKLSKTNLIILFKDRMQVSVMEFYRTLKIEEAKRMIREEQNNFTEIAEKLGYESIHYFSRQFKKLTNMTPSQYAMSVKVKI